MEVNAYCRTDLKFFDRHEVGEWACTREPCITFYSLWDALYVPGSRPLRMVDDIAVLAEKKEHMQKKQQTLQLMSPAATEEISCKDKVVMPL